MSSGVYRFGDTRWYPTDVDWDHSWEFNGRFKILRGKKFFNTKTGELKFSNVSDGVLRPPRKYITKFGVSFAHGGVMYDNSVRNVQAMLSRHFKVKTPESKSDQDEVGNLKMYGIDVNNGCLSFDETLRHNQRIWYTNFSSAACEAFWGQHGRHEYHYDLREASELLALEKHVKKILREREVAKLKIDGRWVKVRWVDFLEWKLKFIEIAKYSKDPRVIVDCTVANSLPRVHFANSWKEFTRDKETIFNNRVRVVYKSSGTIEEIRKGICRHYKPPYGITITHSSDDAVISFNDGTTIRTYNVDISSNDSSHSLYTFAFYAMLSGMSREQQENLETVIMTPFKIYNPSNRRESAAFVPIDGYLPSGIGDTTVCNNAVYFMLAFGLDFMWDKMVGLDISFLTYVGYMMGFRFSYQLTHSFEEVQFLKHSCYLGENGEHVAMVNLGVLLRYSGGGECDILSKVKPPSYVKNAYDHSRYVQSLLTFGFFKKYRYKPLMKSLCPYFSKISGSDVDSVRHIGEFRRTVDAVDDGVDSCWYPTRREFYSRYSDLTELDIDEFEGLVGVATPGSFIYCSLVDKVLRCDYGLSW